MPQDNKKRGRGRREEKKRKAQDYEQDFVTIGDGSTKRQRFESRDGGKTGDTIVLDDGVVEHPHIDNYGDYDESTQPAQTDNDEAIQYFGLLDQEDQSYFKNAENMLELNQFGDVEERRAFMTSVWREARGKELKIASSQGCSRVMERLIRGSEVGQLRSLWGHFAGQ